MVLSPFVPKTNKKQDTISAPSESRVQAAPGSKDLGSEVPNFYFATHSVDRESTNPYFI